MPFGEVGITLQDVEVLWGLRVDGRPVIGLDIDRTPAEWQLLCQELIGFTPPTDAFNGNRLNFNSFSDVANSIIPPDATEVEIVHRARMRLLQLFGGLLFADKSGCKVHLSLLELLRDFDSLPDYSWGSAVLACLYRNLCCATLRISREMAGPALLLQIWAWERFPTLRPQVRGTIHPGARGASLAARWRDSLDGLAINQFIWMPYTPSIMACLPAFCSAGIWKSRVPLIFFYMVEMHHPDRVLRQFGQVQLVPQNPNTYPTLHSQCRRHGIRNWELEHSEYIQMWQDRLQHIVVSHDADDILRTSPEYFQWYRMHCIGPLSGIDRSNSQSTGFQGSAAGDQYLIEFLREHYLEIEIFLQRPNIDQESKKFLERLKAQCMSIFTRLGRLSLLECQPIAHDAVQTNIDSRPSTSCLGRRRSSDRPSPDRQSSVVRISGADSSSTDTPDDVSTSIQYEAGSTRPSFQPLPTSSPEPTTPSSQPLPTSAPEPIHNVVPPLPLAFTPFGMLWQPCAVTLTHQEAGSSSQPVPIFSHTPIPSMLQPVAFAPIPTFGQPCLFGHGNQYVHTPYTFDHACPSHTYNASSHLMDRTPRNHINFPTHLRPPFGPCKCGASSHDCTGRR